MSSLWCISGERVWLGGVWECVFVMILCGGVVWRRGRGEGLLLGSCRFLLRPFLGGFLVRGGNWIIMLRFFFCGGLKRWQI